ncbi:MAG: RidA family protein [Elstera sp.]|jgi:enamine deaminase RidA (YjgF/YER057c/UK114 family)|uniref:RidA family protein n=1 Tax=Elstera sp. TaxID=1916664 RepID=UPI0037C06A93
MAGKVETRLKELGIVVPAVVPPAANYVPGVITGNLLFTAGQLPMQDGKLATAGKVGGEVSVETAAVAAQLCALNVLAVAKASLGSLERIKRLVKVVGFINGVPDFADHAKVMNGASDFFVSVLGEAGKHARSSVGMGSLPFNASVEVEAIFEIE